MNYKHHAAFIPPLFGHNRMKTGLIKPVLVGLSVMLSACGFAQQDQFGKSGIVSGFYGGVTADEPHAVLAGENILAQGGSAADAIITMAFVLSVTKPSSVSLGAGGACVIHDPQIDVNEMLLFLPSFQDVMKNNGKFLTPQLPRAMAALSARYGKKDWRSLVNPAETLARLGVKLPRAHAVDLALIAQSGFTGFNKAAKSMFASKDGAALKEGSLLRQPALAATLANIRINGAGALYQGSLAHRLLQDIAAENGTMNQADLRESLPQFLPVLTHLNGRYEWLLTRPPMIGGIAQAQAFNLLKALPDYDDLALEQRQDKAREAMALSLDHNLKWAENPPESFSAQSRLIFNDPPEWGAVSPPEPPLYGASGMVAIDQTGLTIACDFTLGAPYGGGKLMAQTGIFMMEAPTTADEAIGLYALSPALVIHEDTRLFFYAQAGTSPLLGAGSWLNAEIWLNQSDKGAALLAEIPDSSLPQIGGKPAMVHCINGMPNPEIQDRLCVIDLHPSAHSIARQQIISQ
ncbi:MAG: gamma-glutamyltransferase [Alphaproteobacteria bacterium]